jgi:hypothetical protein
MRVTSFIISSMLTALMTFLATLSSIFRSRAALELENLTLRHQIGVLRRAAAKRLKLTSADRLLWVWLSRIWSGWRSALAIVRPETVVAWHRKGFRHFWTCKVRHGQLGRRSESIRQAALNLHLTSTQRVGNRSLNFKRGTAVADQSAGTLLWPHLLIRGGCAVRNW